MIPRLHLVTDDAILVRSGFPSLARKIMRSEGNQIALHLRGPRLAGRLLFDLAESLRQDAGDSRTLLLMNDRVDVALALDLPGAHLGQRSLPASAARRLLGRERILGLSVHGIGEVEEGGGGDVDFLLVGTLFPSSSHEGATPGGLERLREVSGAAPAPLVGIGGITPAHVGAVLGEGAHGVAVRGGVWDAPDPEEAVGVYLSMLAAAPREEQPNRPQNREDDLRSSP